MKKIYLFIFLGVLGACSTDDNDGNTDTKTQPNILFIIADDMGKDVTHGYPEGSIKPNTPNLNMIRENGLMFNNFWAYPSCSPTRSSMITGKYGYRTDVKWAGDVLTDTDNLLQKYINQQTNDAYATAIIGKWHLSGENTSINPEIYGIDHYAGLISGAVQNYYKWQLYQDGESSMNNGYTSEVFTDLAIEWLSEQEKPWFLWLAYNAPHTPFHIPPAEMHSQGNLVEYEDGMDGTPYFMAAIEAMDYQIGKLIANISESELENTIIIVIGDNGTPNQVAQLPYLSSTAKGTLYQGGINVPLFISGKGVNRLGEDNNLLCSTDMFATIAEIAGVNNSQIYDSNSFKSLLNEDKPIRTFQYAEVNNVRDVWTISNGEYKLIIDVSGNEEMYHLITDPYESDDLLDGTITTIEMNAKIALEAELTLIRN
jgi:arylsulfatase A-like enzyme